jgi:uncharacterized membrane-anchored protein YjiN (DUF445 family)
MSDTEVTQSASIEAVPQTSSESIENSESSNESMELSPEEIENEAKDLGLDADATKEEIKAAKKKFQIKANNKLREVEIDLSNEKEIQKYLEKAFAADERFEEAAQVRKNAASLIDALKNNPRAILSHPDIGVDIKALAQQILNEEAEEAVKTPEQRELEAMKKELEESRAEKKKAEDLKREAEMQKLQEQTLNEITEGITGALEKSSMPKSPYIVKRMADAMLEAVQLGYHDVTPEQILPYVEEQITSEIKRLFEESPDEVLEKFVGKKKLDGYRKTRVEKAKAKMNSLPKKIEDIGKVEQLKEEPKKQSFSSMFGRF